MSDNELNKKRRQIEHFFSIDLPRFGSSLAVIIWHFRTFDNNSTESLPFYNVLAPLYNHGGQAVLLFWSISGFILSRVYLESSTTKRNFLVSRFSRLYPLSLLTLFLMLLLNTIAKSLDLKVPYSQNNDVKHFLLNLFGIPYVGFQSGFSYNVPFWSVSVEIFSYLLFILLLRYLNLYTVATLIIMFALIFKEAQEFIQPEIAQCGFYFFFGVFTHKLHEVYAKYILWISLVFFLMNYLINISSSEIVHKFTDTGLSSVLPMQGILLLFLSFENFLRNLSKRTREFIKLLGNLTYSSYLLHFPMQFTVFMFVRDGDQFLKPVHLISFLIAVYGLSGLVYRFYEFPLRDWINRILGRR